MQCLEYRAGSRALHALRNEGLNAESLAVLVLPAVGPRWLVTSGIDRALSEHGWLTGRKRRLLLLGASVGAWRGLALASRDALASHRALLDGYCAQHFTTSDSPRAISDSFAALLGRVFSDADLTHALDHPDLDLGITTVRAGSWSDPRRRRLGSALLGAAAALNALSPKSRTLFFERVLFHSRAGARDEHALLAMLNGERHPLTHENARAVALASGSVPLYMEPVRDIAGAPPGAYLDGALTDYHLSQPMRQLGGFALLLTHDPRMIPSWLDKFLPWRRGDAREYPDLVVCHPSAAFVGSLPGGVIPARKDFERYVDRPVERFQRWREAAARASELGEAFLHDVQSGALAARVRPL